MSKFRLKKQLPSIKVDKELIERIENYLINDIPAIINIDKNEIIENYSIEIIDSLGTEEFSRISEYPIKNFQNGTQRIKFGFSYYKKSVTRIFISFSVNKYFSDIDISLDCVHPREKAQGIYNGLLDRINPNKTYNYIFHYFFFGVIGGVIIGLLLSLLIYTLINKQYIWSIYLFISSLLLIFIGPKIEEIKPYSEFLTQKQQQYNKIFSFFIWGIISYLIFGLGLGLLQNHIFN